MIRSLTLAALAAALIAPTARAQAQLQGTVTKAAVSDPLFAMAAADGGLAEVTLAEMGVQKATDPALKKFSQHMVEAHTKMNAELMALATQKRMTLPRTLSAGHQFCAQSLAGLSGEEFDRCYAKTQMLIHMDTVAKFETEAERGQDPDLKALAAKALPHIKEHLVEIKPIAMKFEAEKPSTTGAATDRR
jgi:putative membrane protein